MGQVTGSTCSRMETVTKGIIKKVRSVKAISFINCIISMAMKCSGVKEGFGQFWWTAGDHAGDKYVGQFHKVNKPELSILDHVCNFDHVLAPFHLGHV